MDCDAVAARRIAAGCRKAENSVAQRDYLDADSLHFLQHRRTLNEVEMTDSESPCIARPVA